MLEFDVAINSTRMLFVKQYLVNNAAVAWNSYCAAHPGADHTWAAMKQLHYSWETLTKHLTDSIFQKLYSARQGPDQMDTLFGAYIVITCEGTDITVYNKHMFFWIGLRRSMKGVSKLPYKVEWDNLPLLVAGLIYHYSYYKIQKFLSSTFVRADICAAIWKDNNYLTLDACLKVEVKAEMALSLDAEYNKALKSKLWDRV